jgi:hypothetical protein
MAKYRSLLAGLAPAVHVGAGVKPLTQMSSKWDKLLPASKHGGLFTVNVTAELLYCIAVAQLVTSLVLVHAAPIAVEFEPEETLEFEHEGVLLAKSGLPEESYKN